MYSDNTLSFKVANKVLQKLKILFNSDTLQKYVNNFLRAEMFVGILYHQILPT